MKNKTMLIMGIVLAYFGVISITAGKANFANIGLISIGFLMMMYFLWKNKTISKTNLRSKTETEHPTQ